MIKPDGYIRKDWRNIPGSYVKLFPGFKDRESKIAVNLIPNDKYNALIEFLEEIQEEICMDITWETIGVDGRPAVAEDKRKQLARLIELLPGKEK